MELCIGPVKVFGSNNSQSPALSSSIKGQTHGTGSLLAAVPAVAAAAAAAAAAAVATVLQGISCEAGPIVLGRDHFHAALLSTVFSKLQRHHVGSWLLEAARQPEAAAVFEAHAELEAWLVQLAEKRFGKDR
jgi:hypothetical protein